MFNLFGRRRRGVELRVKSRSESAHSARPASVNIDFLAPPACDLVATYAYLELGAFQYLTSMLGDIDDPDARSRVAAVASTLYVRHQALMHILDDIPECSLSREHVDVAAIDAYWERLRPDTWREALLTVMLALGLLEDFGLLLVRTVKPLPRVAVRSVLTDRVATAEIVDLLSTEIERSPWRSDRLSLWGRRLVGDSLLLCRGIMRLTPDAVEALRDPERERSDDVRHTVAQIEAVHEDLIAEHARRMELLRLTA